MEQKQPPRRRRRADRQKLEMDPKARRLWIKRLIDQFTPSSTDECPISSEELFIIGHMVDEARKSGRAAQLVRHAGMAEGSTDCWLQRWAPHAVAGAGRGVSVRGRRVLIFTGHWSGISRD